MRSRHAATLRMKSSSVVTSTEPLPRFSRVAIGSGPNAENSGETTQPFFRPPSRAV